MLRMQDFPPFNSDDNLGKITSLTYSTLLICRGDILEKGANERCDLISLIIVFYWSGARPSEMPRLIQNHATVNKLIDRWLLKGRSIKQYFISIQDKNKFINI
jgi:hypothetical protein